MKRTLVLAISVLVACAQVFAYDFMVDDLCYNINADGTSVTVTHQNEDSPGYSDLSGALDIPSSVSYEGVDYDVTAIGDYAFTSCESLSSIIVGSSITEIGELAFYGCRGLKKVCVSDISSWCNIKMYSAYSNPLFYAHHLYKDDEEITKLTIPDSTTSIGNYAFCRCNYLTEVIVSGSVETIGVMAFDQCLGLTTLTISDSVIEIRESAFYGCANLSALTIGNSVKTIGNSAFAECKRLESITIPNSVETIEERAFDRCESLTAISFGNSLREIYNGAFYGCKNLKSVKISDSVKILNPLSFGDCELLESVELGSSLEILCDRVFENCKALTEITIPSSLKAIYGGAFYGCTSLDKVVWNAKACADLTGNGLPFNAVSSIVLGEDVEVVPKYLCAGNTKITTLEVPASVREIREGAFIGCSNLTMIKVADENTFYNSADNCNAIIRTPSNTLQVGCATTVIPPTVESIGRNAFKNCVGLTAITIPVTVKTVCDNAFDHCVNLTSLVWNAKRCNDLSKDGESPFLGCPNINSVIFGEDVEYVPAALCYKFRNIVAVTIPNSVTAIGDNAFYECTGLATVSVGNRVKKIGQSSFETCLALKEIELPNTITSIGSLAFGGCSGMETLTIGGVVVTFGKNAFAECDGLTKVIWNIKKSGDFVLQSNYINTPPFAELTSIKEFVIGEDVENIPALLCRNLSGLESVTIGGSVKIIGNLAFSGCVSLREVVIPDGVTAVNQSAFSRCVALSSVSIPQSVTSIGGYAFFNCSSLVSVTNYSENPQLVEPSVFEEVDVKACKLNVPHNAVEAYLAANVWKDFLIEDLGGVEGVEADTEAKTVEGYYNLQGVRIDNPARGQVSIVRYTDGTAKKIVVR